ncbi:MAG TPA: hypothetical protein PKD09_12420 [Aggregatilinea sp.]|nr:hypothetical protein [Aggregatilinea sp.]
MHAKSQTNLRPLAVTHSIMRRWLVPFLVAYGLFNALPFAAPVFILIARSAQSTAREVDLKLARIVERQQHLPGQSEKTAEHIRSTS